MRVPVSNTRAARSVLDYETNEQLLAALREAEVATPTTVVSIATNTPSLISSSTSTASSSQSSCNASSPASATSLDPEQDWVLSGYDPDKTQPQSLHDEYQRLLTLKSYDLLDIESDKTMERITAITGRMLHCPIAYVGTMDLGRYNVMAGKGLGILKDFHRKGTFCEHTIQSTEDVFVVTDASKNPYLQDSWFTNNGPKTRFYAASKLVAPEGTVLGTLCVIDPVPRPEGLSLDDKQNIRELADMVVDYLVQRKQAKCNANPVQRVASAAHDLLTPLTAIDLNLSLLKEEDTTNYTLTDLQKEHLTNATRCLSLVKGICRDLIQNATQADCKDDHGAQPTTTGRAEPFLHGSTVVKLDDLVQKISTVMEHHPKRVPLIVSLDPKLPNEIISRDVYLFRSALNYLLLACRDTQKGSIQLIISKSIDTQAGNGTQLPMILFECQDTSPGLPIEQYPTLFQKTKRYPMNNEFDLYSVAQHITQIGGEYGYKPRTDAQSSQQGSTFWFRVPLVLPNEVDPSSSSFSVDSSGHNLESASVAPAPHFPSLALTITSTSLSPQILQDRPKTALVIEDTLVVRKAMSRCLSKLGFQVTQAENGFVGLQKLKEAMYDLVLCDFLMPVLDGIDCVAQFRAWEAHHRPSSQSQGFQQFIVGNSAHAQGKDSERGIQAGMNTFRSKPVTMKDLKELQSCSAVQEASRKLDLIQAQDPTGWTARSGGEDSGEATLPTWNCLIGAESNSDYHRLVQLLNPKKWRVVVVTDGMEALQLLQIQNWDLVVLDEDLPRLSGTRCAKRFREWEKCHRIHRQRNMVLASAYLKSSSQLDAKDVLMPYGFEHMMEKPYLVDACQKVIRQTEENYTSCLTGVDIIAR